MSKEKYFEGIGRRKTSTCRVRIYAGDKVSTVNGKAITDYFASIPVSTNTIMKPLNVTELEGKYYFTAVVSGGGISSQVDSVTLGLARALYSMDESLKPILRKARLVTRDSRGVERKKYSQLKARKKPQFSKR
ncbi:MAG: 30S ribosomal protein S9 [Candidatus Dojkabacteria bacterium]